MVARIRLKKCHYFRNMSLMFLQQQVQNHVDEAIFRRYSLEMTKIEFKNSTNTKKQDIGLLFLETIQSFANQFYITNFIF